MQLVAVCSFHTLFSVHVMKVKDLVMTGLQMGHPVFLDSDWRRAVQASHWLFKVTVVALACFGSLCQLVW